MRDSVAVNDGPGATDPFDPEDLDDLRQRVVLPVVSSLLAADELVSVEVRRGPDEEYRRRWAAHLAPDDLESIWVNVAARDDERWASTVWSPQTAWAARTLGEVAANLADRLEDWVCETRFGWGQQRVADYLIPAR
jgi:hypothetical protein